MKLAAAFLLSFLVLVSQQQRLPYQSRVLTPWAFRDNQFNDIDLYTYLLARRLAQSSYPAQFDAYAGNNANLFIAPQPGVDLNEQKLLDVEARFNSFGRDPILDQVNPRFLFSTVGSTYYNPLLRTLYAFSTSTITSTAVTTCIPATYFVAASSTIACRKRREVLEVMRQMNVHRNAEEAQIAPSSVESIKVQPTADPTGGFVPAELASSIDEKTSENSFDFKADSPRSKRLFGGLFFSTSTLTSYVVSTASSTKTLTTLATTSALSCRPSGYIIC